jgi:hypothetical protein
MSVSNVRTLLSLTRRPCRKFHNQRKISQSLTPPTYFSKMSKGLYWYVSVLCFKRVCGTK